MNVTIGIDPGVKGAICILWCGGGIEVHAIPYIAKELNVEALKAIVIGGREYPRFPEWYAWIENARPMSRHGKKHIKCWHCGAGIDVPASEGVISVATFVGNARLIEGVLLGMGIDVTRVNPKDWQKVALPGVKGREALKRESIKVAEDRFPGLNLFPTKRSRKKSDNISDAAHIAWFGSRCSAGGTA